MQSSLIVLTVFFTVVLSSIAQETALQQQCATDEFSTEDVLSLVQVSKGGLHVGRVADHQYPVGAKLKGQPKRRGEGHRIEEVAHQTPLTQQASKLQQKSGRELATATQVPSHSEPHHNRSMEAEALNTAATHKMASALKTKHVPPVIEPTLPRGYEEHRTPSAFPVSISLIMLCLCCCCGFFVLLFTQQRWAHLIPKSKKEHDAHAHTEDDSDSQHTDLTTPRTTPRY